MIEHTWPSFERLDYLRSHMGPFHFTPEAAQRLRITPGERTDGLGAALLMEAERTGYVRMTVGPCETVALRVMVLASGTYIEEAE